MQKLKTATLVLAVVLGLIAVFWGGLTFTHEAPTYNATALSSEPKTRIASSGGRKPPKIAQVAHRESAEFLRLVDRWSDVNGGANWGIYGPVHYEFARECILTFGCGDELIRFISTLKAQDSAADHVFNKAIRQILSGPEGAAQRPLISGITSDPATRNRWSYFAGAGCTPEELDSFASSLNNEADRNAARVGTCLKVAATDPGAGIAAAAVEIEAGRAGAFKSSVFFDIVKMTDDLDKLPAVESELRLSSSLQPDHDKFVDDARNQLLRQWTDKDPDNLISYFNAHEESMSGREAESVMSQLAVRDSAKAFELVQNLEHAAHFDSAAVAVILYTAGKYPEQARELAQQIHSPSERGKALLYIESAEASRRAAEAASN